MLRRLCGCEKGLSLIEIILAAALLGIVATGIIAALATSLRVTLVAEEQAVSATLATSQLEDILSTVPPPDGFSLSQTSATMSPRLEQITVTVLAGGEEMYRVTTYKVTPDW